MNKYILYTIFRVFVIAVTTYKTIENLEIGIPEEAKDKPISKQLANYILKKKKKKKIPFLLSINQHALPPLIPEIK